MKQVSKKEYWNAFCKKDCVLSIVGNYPYASEWTMRGYRQVIARHTSHDKDDNGNVVYPPIEKYYIA